MDEDTGRSFGPYRLGELLGRGGMGEVYRAHHTGQGRVVALKVLRPELSEDADFRRRFLRESRLAARLNDPHVIPVHGWGEVEGRLYLDMRYVDGEDLARRLARTGALPPARAVAVLAQVAGALDAAHDAGLVHRDVKPSNVLLATPGPGRGVRGDFAYLVDFGIASATDGAGTALTTTGSALAGSPAYMAPERFLGQPAGPPADVYALACVLHETLTGRRPFAAAEAVAFMWAHLEAPPPRPSRLAPGVPAGFDEVVAVGLAKDPARRYPSAGELARAAQEVLGAGGARPAPARPVPARPTAVAPAPTVRVDPGPRAAADPHPPVRPAPVRPVAPDPGRPAPSGRERRAGPAGARRTGGLLLPAAAALVTGVLVVAGVLLAVRPAPPGAAPSTTSTPSAPVGPALPDADRALLAALPVGIERSGCVSDPERPADAVAALRCEPGPEGESGSARFRRFADIASLDRALTEDAAGRGLPEGVGDCEQGIGGRRNWDRDGVPAGLLACGRDPDGAWTLHWTEHRVLTLGTVTRTDGDAAALWVWFNRYDFR